jgi:glycosyltransferase involved in cell wall biosynthesis
MIPVMRILMLNHNLIGRGSFLRCWNFARELVTFGHQVEILTTSDRINRHWAIIEQEGVQIRMPPRLGKVGQHDGGYSPLDTLLRLPMAMKDWDLIHAFEHRPNVLVPALASRFRRTPLVTDWSDWWTRGGITTSRRRFEWIDQLEATFLEEGTKKLADRITLVSRVLQERALSMGIKAESLVMVPSGCDYHRIVPEDKRACRLALGLPPSVPVLCFSGFAFWDFQFLLEAFRRVLEAFTETHLLVVGEDKDGEIQTLARETLGPRFRQVIFAGRFKAEELSRPLGAADIHLLPLPDNPANRARWPIKFGDYLASGRPLVLSDVGDTPIFLAAAQAGLVTPPTPEGMADGILSILRQPELGVEMGIRARKLAETDLSWTVQTRKLETCYLDLLKSKSQ